MSDAIRVTGLKELNDALNKLTANVALKHARGAVAAGARVIRDAAIENVTKGNPEIQTGTLKRAIYSRWMREMSTMERISFFVSVKRGKVYRPKTRSTKGGKVRITADRDAFYWTWVEFGHLARTKKSGAVKGGKRRRDATRNSLKDQGAKFVAARPFMRPAYEANKRKAIEAIRDELTKRIFENLRG
ncbi:MAG: HK97 gp10 family phage protein [Rhodocyclaceae bacterium]|nr:HK97 gp10 family phage protein [Rhodocyclaceae bacterium]